MTLSEPPLPDLGQLIRAITAEPVTASDLVRLPSAFSGSLYRRGSFAMAAAVQAVQRKGDNSKLVIWIPDYFCNDALHPIRKLNVKLVFYPVNADLTVNWEAVSRTFDGRHERSVFVLVHYFGFPNETEKARRFCDDRSMVLMEDAAHCLGVSNSMGAGDFLVFSPRKLLPSPFGGVLATRSGSFDSEPPPHNAPVRPELMQWLCRRVLQKTLNTAHVPWHFASAYQNPPATEASSNGSSKEDSGCDPYVRKLLTVLISDREAVFRKRRAHYEILSGWVMKTPDIEPVFSQLPSHVCPYVFPVRLRGNASGVVASLRKIGIPASRWPDLPPEALSNPSSHQMAIEIYGRVILLPIHQSLATSDIERIGLHLANSLS